MTLSNQRFPWLNTHEGERGEASFTSTLTRHLLRPAAGASLTALCLAGTLSGVALGNDAYQQASDGNALVTIEAENYHSQRQAGGQQWTASYPADASSGVALEATPNGGTNRTSDYVSNSPRLDYRVNFLRAGLHYVWLRGLGASVNDDSAHVGLNGSASATSHTLGNLSRSGLNWLNRQMDGDVAVIDVPQAGEHTVNLWMREDGAIIDKLLLTPNPAYQPTGKGPAASPLDSADATGGGSSPPTGASGSGVTAGGLPINLQGATPEQASVTIDVDKPADAIEATLTLQVFDADNTSEGKLAINSQTPITLFGSAGKASNDNNASTVTLSTPVAHWVDGANTLTFTHTQTNGYIVDDISVAFTRSAPAPEPSTPTEPATSPSGGGVNIQLMGSTPESKTIKVAADKPANAQDAVVRLTVLDPDHPDEGELIVNGGKALPLFGSKAGGAYDGKVAEFTFNMPAADWVNGDNTLVFRHLRTNGFTIQGIGVSFTTAPTGGSAPALPAGGSTTSTVDLRGTAPEAKTITLNVSKPADATTATVLLTTFDADHPDEGRLTINGNPGLDLFGPAGKGANDNHEADIAFTTPASHWNNGANTLRFEHLKTSGYVIDAIVVGFDGADSGGAATTNRAPSIGGTPGTLVYSDESYSFTPSASDPDGDDLTFAIGNKPSWASFNTTSGRLSGKPSASQAGKSGTISISVSDGQATTYLPGFSIEVIARANAEPADGELDRSGRQWSTLEWSLTGSGYSGNAYDLAASAVFVHQGSNEMRTTPLFYAGGNTWTFRFTPSRTGTWTFSTTSANAGLNGRSGVVSVTSAPAGSHGFLRNYGNKWGWEGSNTATVPQLVMLDSINAATVADLYQNPAGVDAIIDTFMSGHGFTGFHLMVAGQWFDLYGNQTVNSGMKEPDPRTFDALELLITRVHQAGGSVHLWAWGDHQRTQTARSLSGGANGAVDKRLQRYIAARLGPLPGWSMGYGFDLDEWAVSPNLVQPWHDHLHQLMGWSHFLGGRPAGPNSGTNHAQFNSFNGPLDYSSYEHHRPSYDVYVAALSQLTSQPVMSEDRFRVRDRSKDYTEDETRRGLWHSTMAGGVANIWGQLNSGNGAYGNRAALATYGRFFGDGRRFTPKMARANSLSSDASTRVLRDGNKLVAYREAASSIQLNLSAVGGSRRAIAVDTRKGYAELALGTLSQSSQTVKLPYSSDWAIAVGDF